jgi:hypothetical protein
MNISQAPVAFSSYTTLAGTTAQKIQYNAAGVAAGFAGNLYLTTPPSNLLNGTRFKIIVSGYVVAHGASQTVAPGLLLHPYTAAGAAPATNDAGTATFTPVGSGTLTAATVYDFTITQEFFGTSNSGKLTCFAPQVYMNGVPITIVTTTGLQSVTFASDIQTSPITGINTTYNNPLASFSVSLTNSVSDTVETAALTEFFIAQA